MPRTSHVTTTPQQGKSIATRKRHLELRRRDKSIKFRQAWNDGWNDPRRSFIDTLGWDTIDAPTAVEIDEELVTAEFYRSMMKELEQTFDIDPDVLPCGCIGTCEYDAYADGIQAEIWSFYDEYPEFLEDIDASADEQNDEDDDPTPVDDFGGYARLHGIYLIKRGSGFGFDSVFGEGYLSGNCGFSVRARP